MIETDTRDGAAPSSSKNRAAHLRWPLLAVTIGVVLTYWPLLAGQIVLQRDPALWIFPARWFVRQALLAGQSPTWNPLQGLGFPLLADPQYALFYPPHWLFLVVPDGLVAHLASWLNLAHLIWGGLGMALLTRRLGACSLGAAVAGLSWALSGHTTSAWLVGTLLLGHAWIPWVARGFLGLARNEGRSPLVGALWPLALSFLAGEVFMSAMALAFAAIVVLATANRIRPTRSAGVTAAKAGAVWLVAMAIAAITWVPPLLMLKSTERARPFDRATAGAYSHHPLRIIEMVAPGALGDPTGEYPAGEWIGEPAAAGAPLFFSSYLGIATLGLALLGLRRRRLPLVLAGAALLALFVAFGRHTPVHQVWRTIVFPFAHMHSPEKYVVLVVASLAPLAGLGASRLLSTGDKPRLRRLLVLVGALAVLALAARLLLPAELVSTARGAGLRGLLTLVLLFVLILLLRRCPEKAGLGLLALVALDLALPASRLTGFGSAKLLTHVPPAAATILDDSRRTLAPPRVFREPGVDAAGPALSTPTWQDGQEFALQALTPSTPNVFGLAVVPGYEAAIPDLLAQLGPKTFADLGRMLRLLAVPYALVTDAAAKELGETTAITTLSRPLPGASLLRLDHTLPRVYLPSQVRQVAPAEAALRLRDEAVISGQQVLLLTAETASLTWPSDGGEPRPCTLESFDNTRIVALCSTPSPTVAVFVEQYDRGWSATVDGESAPIVRANLLARAVPLSAGSHRIELQYRTPGLWLVMWLSVMGLLGAAVFWRRARRHDVATT